MMHNTNFDIKNVFQKWFDAVSPPMDKNKNRNIRKNHNFGGVSVGQIQPFVSSRQCGKSMAFANLTKMVLNSRY